jgi:murein DD-endopeptidase MepM/ murein hydrolase activator NlpD
MDKHCSTRAKMEVSEARVKRLMFAVLGLATGAGAAAWLLGARPVISLAHPVTAIGAATPVTVKVHSRSGVRRFRARVEQGPASAVLHEEAAATPRWKFWRARNRQAEFRFQAGRTAAPQLQDGPARLVLEAEADDWRGRRSTLAVDLTVRTRPPSLRVDAFQHYINQGGADLVVFTAGPETVESGLRLGPHQFRSWPAPGGPAGARFVLYAFPYDTPPGTAPVVYARDAAGNEATAAFWHRVFPRRFRTRDFVLTPDFLEKVVRQFPPATGDLLADFLRINRQLRVENNRQLSELRWKTEERFLWSRPFRQLADSQVEARFADHRRYYYQGQKVDEQDHLGFDLAVTANAPVVAANDGLVIFADFLGIYGNCIVIDHGFSLQSIYGHLSAVAVKAGQTVAQGQEIGRSGATGLAGGDHLHFSIQVDGVQTSAIEWWDPRWIQDRIWSRLPSGGPSAGVSPSGNMRLPRLVHR